MNKLLWSAILVLLFCTPVSAQVSKQGKNQCVAYAVVNAIEAQARLSGTEVDYSPKWLYRECKKIDGIKQSGTTVRVALTIAQREGWIGEFYKVEDIKEHLDNGKFVIITTEVRQNWRSGLILPSEKPFQYWHTTYLEGYGEYYLGVNSWGTRWGYEGRYKMSLDYEIREAWVFDEPKPII